MDYHTYTQYTDSYLNAQAQTYNANQQPPNSNYQNYTPSNYIAPPGQTQSYYPTQTGVYDYTNYPPPNYGSTAYPTSGAYPYQSSDPRLNSANRGATYTNLDYSQNYENAEYDNYYVESQKTYDLALKDPEKAIPPKSDDELWVETFLSDIGKIKLNLESTIEIKRNDVKVQPLAKPTLEIHSAKHALNKCLGLIEQLKKTQEYLNANVESMSSAEWKKNTVEIGLLKDEFSSLMVQFESMENIKVLQRALEKRKRKRLRQKNKKEERRQILTEKYQNLKLKEKKIDDWLENMKDAVERFKMEENMKKDADCVLAEVTKKKSDSRKQLSLISSLIKLRGVREQAALQRGEKTSLEDRSVFANITEKLSVMWQNAQKSYNKEDQGLRMMLEQNATEDSISARLAKEKKVMQEWELVFFGPKTIPSPAYWGLTSSERDVETFIAIRKSWDTFLSKAFEDGTKIPVGWILPNANANENWTKYLQK